MPELLSHFFLCFMKFLLLVVVAGLSGLALYGLRSAYQRRSLDSSLDMLMSRGAIILDVRTPFEYAQGHVPGSINVPLSRLRDAQLPLNPRQTYVTCCSHGLRSIKAVDVLRARGFQQVYNGGIWSDLRCYSQQPVSHR